MSGNVVGDLPLAQLVRGARNVHAAVFDRDDCLEWANDAFITLIGADVGDMTLDDLFLPVSAELIRVARQRPDDGPLLLQLARHDVRATLRVLVQRTPPGFALAGEPLLGSYAELEERLLTLNAELATLARERAREARVLERLHRELRDAHWHIRKTAEVLPMCVSCRAVAPDGSSSWQEPATFLERHARFLSHGYCAVCAEAVLAEVDRGDVR